MNLETFLQSLSTGDHGAIYALGITFVAGLVASAVCPCTLPVGLGVASVASASEAGRRRSGLYIAAAFSAGVVASLTILGALAAQLGALTTEWFGRNWALGMAIVTLVAALAAFCWPRVKLDRLASWRRPRMAGAFLYGLAFSVGTSVAPLLLLLTVAAAAGRTEQGILLAFVFGLGRALPFLVVGAAASAVTRMARISVWSRVVQIASGVILLGLSGYYGWLYTALA